MLKAEVGTKLKTKELSLSLSYSGSNLAGCPVAKVTLDLLKSTSPLHLIYPHYIYEGHAQGNVSRTQENIG